MTEPIIPEMPGSEAVVVGRGTARTTPAPFSAVSSWVVYDLANTIFSMGITSRYFSLYMRDELQGQSVDAKYTGISAVSMAIIFVLSPLLGSMSDRASRRMPFLVASTIMCVGFTMLFGRVSYALTLGAFVIANAAYQAGLQFYDSLLPEVSTEENRGRIGGIGVGVGYLGSFLAIILGEKLGSTGNWTPAFTAIAIAFLVLAIPCFIFVHERGNPNPGRVFDLRVIGQSARQTVRTLREGERYPGLVRFLVGRVFYTDAINTVILIMTLYAVNLLVRAGGTEDAAQGQSAIVMAVAIAFAVVGGLLWGRIVDRIGPKRTLNIVLYLWMFTFALAAMLGLLHLPIFFLYVVGTLAGIALGGTWAADRPLMLTLTPPDRVGEFYGLYGMVGRFSAIIGPTIWSLVALLTMGVLKLEPATAQGYGVLVLLGMIITSWLILRPVDDARRDWEALAKSSSR